MIRALLFLLLPFTAQAETLRIATFNTELSRDGPGLLLRDIRGGDRQVMDVVSVIAAAAPDVIALQGIDWDFNGLALQALAERLAEAGAQYPHRFSRQPNAGLETGLDLDGDGRLHGPGDAQGWGQYTGQGGLAVLSRYPIADREARDFSGLLWRDLPGARLPETDGRPFPSPDAQAAQRLSSTAHWVVPIDAPSGRFELLTFHAAPPVFDGPEDRNGLRNRDELRLWQVFLDGALGPGPDGRFVIAGDANLDPKDSEGHTAVMQGLLSDPRLQDPRPRSDGAAQAGPQGHRAPDDLDTVDWDGAGRLRVDYVLPSAGWRVVGAGVHWPAPDQEGHDTASRASRHRLVWVDLAR
ncbi:endonuclease/exonuclease/phosphatase family protein [Ruegeria sediminis]|uniref:Endonuclease/exonuclease/phosphatase family protein n=1 Tax=Ruegeria sediminis TaxID=2583820 RepID=A0ABY2WWJ4_9RHOB|nr:endonuclease/exonuclease/phosphatase family protein [Ruegeria sediminis]TMV07134.1 endonuclease/exonuclease/phosphatase family protein [Ruegeria sediminis]